MNKTTIKDVSRLAGVSIATVSYVLNNTPGKTISAQTSKRVRDAAEQLHYVSNTAAKSLQSGTVGCIGVVIDQRLVLARYAQELQGIVDALAPLNFNVMMCTRDIEKNGLPNYINAYLSRKVDALIYIGAEGRPMGTENETFIIERRIPCVTSDCETSRLISSVNADYLDGAYRTVKYILSLGARRIFYIRPDRQIRQETERELGVRRAVFEQQGATFDFIVLPHSGMMADLYMDDGKIASFLSSAGPDSAFIGSWSGMDMPLVMHARRLGLNIPLSALALGALTAKFAPNMHYCYLPSYEIGVSCAKAALALVGGGPITHDLLRCGSPDEPRDPLGADYYITFGVGSHPLTDDEK